MNCPKCDEPFALAGDIGSTCVAYYSPAGHDHDDNCKRRGYKYPNGHVTYVSRQNRCPACDWVGKLECFCHLGQKLTEWPEAARELTTRQEMKVEGLL